MLWLCSAMVGIVLWLCCAVVVQCCGCVVLWLCSAVVGVMVQCFGWCSGVMV